jgi:mannose-6-phosphate isomerase
MTAYRGILGLPPNRVRRNYPGGRTLDAIEGNPSPADSAFAEDWIASATRSSAADATCPNEGISIVLAGHERVDFASVLAGDPDYYLGSAHAAKFGPVPQVLVKYLDSGTRLHFQVHPTRNFARRHLGVTSGKTEAYHILDVRPDLPEPPYIYAGFQHPPSSTELKRMIERQELVNLEACFEKIRVQSGDTFLIPGGTPHALGAGIFTVEIQEPTDLVVRYEFERAGITLPESARFMGRDLDFALRVFNLERVTREDVDRRLRCLPRRLRSWGDHSWQDELIGPDKTECFGIKKVRLGGVVEKAEKSFSIVFVTEGTVTVEAVGHAQIFHQFEKFFVPAGIGKLRLIPTAAAELLECFPPPT